MLVRSLVSHLLKVQNITCGYQRKHINQFFINYYNTNSSNTTRITIIANWRSGNQTNVSSNLNRSQKLSGLWSQFVPSDQDSKNSHVWFSLVAVCFTLVWAVSGRRVALATCKINCCCKHFLQRAVLTLLPYFPHSHLQGHMTCHLDPFQRGHMESCINQQSTAVWAFQHSQRHCDIWYDIYCKHKSLLHCYTLW